MIAQLVIRWLLVRTQTTISTQKRITTMDLSIQALINCSNLVWKIKLAIILTLLFLIFILSNRYHLKILIVVVNTLITNSLMIHAWNSYLNNNNNISNSISVSNFQNIRTKGAQISKKITTTTPTTIDTTTRETYRE